MESPNVSPGYFSQPLFFFSFGIYLTQSQDTMIHYRTFFILCASAFLLLGCDTNHKSEFYRIQRDDIQGYEEFIRKYPSSTFVSDAHERIETAKEEKRQKEEQERRETEARCLESLYGNNSLSNGSQPYSRWYGANHYYDDYTAHSEIRVKAPYNSDVIAIVRYNNMNGNVAGHKYIKAGNSATIYLRNGSYYQTFFYYGKG